MDTLMGVLMFIVQFAVAVGAWFVVPPTVHRVVRRANQHQELHLWHADAITTIILAILAVLAFIFFPGRDGVPLATIILSAEAVLMAVMAQAAYQGRKQAERTF